MVRSFHLVRTRHTQQNPNAERVKTMGPAYLEAGSTRIPRMVCSMIRRLLRRAILAEQLPPRNCPQRTTSAVRDMGMSEATTTEWDNVGCPHIRL